jgi:hypothetical protein
MIEGRRSRLMHRLPRHLLAMVIISVTALLTVACSAPRADAPQAAGRLCIRLRTRSPPAWG